MKIFPLSALIICTICSEVLAESSVFTAYKRGGAQAPLLLSGLSESIYDYMDEKDLRPENKQICYTGEVETVCRQLETAAERSQERYRDGAHDVMNLESCKVEKNRITAAYELREDDGGRLQVLRILKPCPQGD